MPEWTLKTLRIRNNLTQTEAAEKLGISPAKLSNWEKSKTFPNVPEIIEIEKLYGISYADIKFLPS